MNLMTSRIFVYNLRWGCPLKMAKSAFWKKVRFGVNWHELRHPSKMSNSQSVFKIINMASHLSESQSIGVPFGSCLPESVFRAFLENAFYLGGSAPKLDCSRAGLDLPFFLLSLSVPAGISKISARAVPQVSRVSDSTRSFIRISTKIISFESWKSKKFDQIRENVDEIQQNCYTLMKIDEIR